MESVLAKILLGAVVLLFSFASDVTAVPGHGDEAEALTAADGRIRGVRDRTNKDFVLGGLFPVHSDDAESGGGRCGEVRLERGLERMEAMLFALDSINADTTLLPELSLGFDIRDTCNSENIGLDESIDLIITGSQLDIESCQSALVVVNGSEDAVSSVPTSGIVGAAASRVSVPIASLVRLFDTPQVSYASSSSILNNRDRYEYFYRTIPPDNLQAKAMIDLMLRFNWTYVSTIYSRNPYGEPGIDEFRALAANNSICINLNEGIDDDYDDEDFQGLADRLVASDANVVILFASQDNADELLTRIAESSARHRFTWIASDAWARSINTVHRFNETAAGLFGIAPLTSPIAEFQDYFSSLTISSNKRNPWFPEFYAAFVNCTLNDTCDENLNITRLPKYEQGNFIPLVIDAVYTYAHALQDYLDENCEQPLVWQQVNQSCIRKNQTRPLNGEVLLEYISRANFFSPTGNKVLYDSEGNVEGKYEILNYHAADVGDNKKEYFFQSVGVWDSSVVNDSNLEALSLNDTMLQFGVDESQVILYVPPMSQCGRCEPGQFRRQLPSSCCGICDPCLGNNYSSNPLSTSCMQCPDHYWGNEPFTGSDRCVAVDESFLDFTNPWSIVVMLVASTGLVAVGVVAVVFGIFWTTPVVKSSGREQMVTLLFGIGASFALTFIFVSPPSIGVCLFQRAGLWLAFAVMFGALLVKIIRVARIFLRSTHTLTRPRFTEPAYQILFTMIIVFGQALLVMASLAYTPPDIEREETRRNDRNDNDAPVDVVTCKADPPAFLALSILYETAIIILSTILGGLSFQYPENFNEAKYIAFCAFSLMVVWVAFIPTYFATQDSEEFQNIAISVAVIFSAFAVLILIFGPKLYIIVFQPKRNTASFSTHQGGARDFQSQNEHTFGNSSPSINAVRTTTKLSSTMEDERKGMF